MSPLERQQTDRQTHTHTDTASVQRRLVFATSFLPPDIPFYWNIVADFANQAISGKSSISQESARIAMGNVEVLYKDAFCSDVELTKQLISMEYSKSG